MIRSNTIIFTLITTFLVVLNGNSLAVEFQECKKFQKKGGWKHYDCLNYSFSESFRKSEFKKIEKQLDHRIENKSNYSSYLTILMCGNHANMAEGKKPFKRKNRKEILKLTNRLLNLGASFDSMPPFSIVTPLFCLSNRGDSEILNFVLTSINATSKDLDASLYEGNDLAHVPLYRAILNNDIKSAKVLVKHGASPNFNTGYNETTLKTALQKNNIQIANWLLDIGATVHKKDDGEGCSGKSALDYALVLPKNLEGREQIIKRIKNLINLPSDFKNNCNKTKA